MNLATLKTWIQAHRKPLLAAGAAAAVGAALYARHRANTSSAATGSAAQVAPVNTQTGTAGLGYGGSGGYDSSGYGSSGYDGSYGGYSSGSGAGGVLSSIDTSLTGEQATLGTISGLLGQVAKNTAPPPPPKTAPHTTPIPVGSHRGTRAGQIDQYVIEYDKKTGASYDVTSRGTVHRLTADQLARDLAAGATRVEVAAKPVAAARPKAPVVKHRTRPATPKPVHHKKK